MTLEHVIILVPILLAVLAVSYYFLQPGKNQPTSIKDLYTAGLDLMVMGHLQQAYQNFRLVVKQDTDHIHAYLKLGQVAREGGNTLQALKIHSGLVNRTLTPYERVELYKNLALDHYAAGELKAAIQNADHILELDRKNEWALAHLVIYHRELGNWDKAGQYLAQHQKVSTKPDTRRLGLYKIQEGRILLKDGDFSGARQRFEQALKIENGLGAAHYFLGHSFVLESDQIYSRTDELESKFGRGASDQKEYQKAIDNARGVLAKALPHWVQFCHLEPEDSWLVLAKLKDALFALDRYQEIEGILRQILAADPDNVEALASLADYYHHRGENREAMELIESVLEKDPDSLAIRLIRLKMTLDQPDQPDQISELDKMIEIVFSKKYHQFKEQDDSDIRWLLEVSGDLESLVT